MQEHLADHVEIALHDPLLYGDYRTALQPDQPRLYEDIQDYDAAKGLFDEVLLLCCYYYYCCCCCCCLQILEEYNEKYNPMNLVLFDDALEHLTRVHRVIRMDQGHALLVGVGGVADRV